MGARARLLPLALAALVVGCSAARQSRRLEGRYELSTPGAGWREVRPGGADRAWLNEELDASIYSDSNCGVRYEDSALSALATHLTLGLEDALEIEAEEGMLDGRRSFTRRVRGALDGVPVELAATVLKKDQCVYDLVLIAPPSTFEAALADFQALRDGFRTRGQ